MSRWILAIAMLAYAAPAGAQARPLDELLVEENERRASTNVAAMSILGSWAVLNIGVGAVGWAVADEEWVRNFHLMNAGWNVVNATIAGFGAYGALTEDPQSFDVWETIDESEFIERALLINAALDLAYIGFGAYLAVRGDRDGDPMQLGFGRSVAVQGAFLFAFDVAIYAWHATGNAEFMKSLRAFRLQR